MIVATAGHVDHGKTALVRALTGVDTDRLPEEKARGLTVDLGFAYLALPSGDVAGFIDVPGHERFVRNMVAGVAGIDLALVVVAADDGVMPQTREHVAVLDLLGVRRALVALTKTDRVDDGRAAEVAHDVEALLAATGMAGAPVFPTSAPRGGGIEALLAALDGIAAGLPAARHGGGFRLAVDRVFVLKGAGVVVTGTVHGGSVGVGDRVAVMPSGLAARVRSIHAQDRAAEAAGRGERAALNLAGIAREDAVRGDWVVTPDLLRPSDRLDVALTVLASEARPLRHGTPVHVHLGAGHVTGRVAVLQGGAIVPGGSALAQLVLDRPVVAAFGDRVVLRDQSARRTIAGGRIVDPEGPARGRARPDRLARLAAMDRDEPAAALGALLEATPRGIDLAWFTRARNLLPDEADTLIAAVDMVRPGRDRARALAPGHWRALQAAVLQAVADDHAARSDRLGPSAAELQRLLPQRPDAALLEDAIRSLAEDGRLARRGAVAHLPGHTVTLVATDRERWQRVEATLVVEDGTPPALFPLAEAVKQTPAELERFLERMAGYGLVVRVARNRYLTPAQIGRYAAAVQAAAAPDGFTAAQFRDAAGIGRNLAIDLLEHFDRSGITRRRGDLRWPQAADEDALL